MAADANLNGSVSTADIALLRKLILGKILQLPKGWRFMYKEDYDGLVQAGGDPTPLFFSDYYENLFLLSKYNVDFACVKVGELNKGNDCDMCNLNFREEKTNLGIRNQIVSDQKRLTTTPNHSLNPPYYSSSSTAYILCEDGFNNQEISCKVFLNNQHYEAGVLSLNLEGDYYINEVMAPNIPHDIDFKSVINRHNQNVRFLWVDHISSSKPIAVINLIKTSNRSEAIRWSLDPNFSSYTSMINDHSQIIEVYE